MKRAAIFVSLISVIVLLYVGCNLRRGLANEESRIALESETSNWSPVYKSQQVAVAVINLIGRDWYLHALVFSGFSVAGACAHKAVRTRISRGALTAGVFFVMLLGTAVFMLTEQLSGILTIDQRIATFQGAFQVKLGSVLVALFAGRTFFEMFKECLK